MAHPGKEVRLCPIGMLRHRQSVFQGFGLLCQPLLHLPQFCHVCYIYKNSKINRTAILPVHTGCIGLLPQCPAQPAPYAHNKMNRFTGQQTLRNNSLLRKMAKALLQK